MLRRSPIRTCVGCGNRDAQPRLLRLQLEGAADLSPVARAHAGRSAYLHTEPSCIAGLLRSRSLARSLRRDVSREARQRCVERVQSVTWTGTNPPVVVRTQRPY